MAKKTKEAPEAAERTMFDDQPEETGKKGKQKKEKKSKKNKEGKPKRKKGKLFLILLIVLLLAALCAAVYFDWLQVRTKMIDFLSSFDEQYVHYSERVQEAEDRLVELEEWENVLTEEENRLIQRAAKLDERERQLNQQEEYEAPIYRGTLSDEKLAELKSLGKIYSSMSAESAAAILPKLYGVTDMAAIIFYMDNGAAADLMEALNSDLAAQITTEMLRE